MSTATKRIWKSIASVLAVAVVYVAWGVGLSNNTNILSWAVAIPLTVCTWMGVFLIYSAGVIWWEWVKDGDRHNS